MSKLIGKIPIGGHLIPVRVCSPKFGVIGEGNLAEFCSSKLEINICETVSPKQRRCILAHECFHAFLELTGHSEQLSGLSDRYEEALTLAFERMLGHFFVFPPKIEKWLEDD